MRRPPPRSTRTDTPVPYPTLVRSPDAGAPDYREVGCSGEDVGVDFRRRADREAVIIADDRDQLVLGLAGDLVDLHSAFPEDRGGFGVHLVADEDFGLGHFDSFQKLRSS